MYQVDSEDANFLFLEKAESPTHISLMYLYDQSSLGDKAVRFKHIREHISNRVNSAPVFSQKIQRTPADLDYPYWVDDKKFDLYKTCLTELIIENSLIIICTTQLLISIIKLSNKTSKNLSEAVV